MRIQVLRIHAGQEFLRRVFYLIGWRAHEKQLGRLVPNLAHKDLVHRGPHQAMVHMGAAPIGAPGDQNIGFFIGE